MARVEINNTILETSPKPLLTFFSYSVVVFPREKPIQLTITVALPASPWLWRNVKNKMISPSNSVQRKYKKP